MTFVVLVSTEDAKSPLRIEKLRPGNRPDQEVQWSQVWNVEPSSHPRAGPAARLLRDLGETTQMWFPHL